MTTYLTFFMSPAPEICRKQAINSGGKKEHVMLADMETPEDSSANEYEEIRRRNMEDNKIMLAKLMEDMKGVLPRRPPVTKARRPYGHSTPEKIGPMRRNPSRHARYHPSRVEPPRTRARSNSVSSSISTSSSCTPELTPEKLVVRFGFFSKPASTKADFDAGPDEDSLDLPSPSRKPRVYRDARSAEEIADEDLELVATFVSDKKYDSIYGTTCHQCRQKTADTKTICRAPGCGGVRGQFCGPCLRNRYGEDARLALKDPNWQCPSCRGICNCSFCRRRKGKSCTGILIHLAREQGFSDVHSYLKGITK